MCLTARQCTATASRSGTITTPLQQTGDPGGRLRPARGDGGRALALDDLLALAAVLGSSFDVEDLAVLAARPVGEVLLAVVEGLGRGVLDGSGSQLTFCSEEQRRRLPAGLSSWTFRRLTAVSGGVRPRPPARPVSDGALADGALAEGARADKALAEGALAEGARADGALAEGARALRWLRWTAGRVGAASPEVAVELLQSAVPLAAGAERQEVVAELALMLFRAARHEDAEEVTREALRHPPAGAEAALREALVTSLVSRGRVSDAEHEARVALAGDRQRRAWLLAARSLALLFAHRLAGADRLAQEAEVVAIGEDDRRARALALRTRALVALQQCRLADSDRLSATMVDVARGSQVDDTYGAALLVRALVLTDLDRPLDALRVLGQGTRIIETAGRSFDALVVGAYVGAAHFWAGRWDEAAAQLAVAAQGAGATGWVVDATAQLAVLWAARGRLDEADRCAAAAEACAPVGPVSAPGRLDWMRGMLAEAHGDLGAARTHLMRAWLSAEAAGVAREQRVVGPALVRAELQGTERSGHRSPVAARVVEAMAVVARDNLQVPGLAGAAAWVEGLVARDPVRVVEGLELLRISGRRYETGRCAADAALLWATAVTDPADPAACADPADPADPAACADLDPADCADLDPAVPAVCADTDLAVPAACADPAAPAGPAVPAGPGDCAVPARPGRDRMTQGRLAQAEALLGQALADFDLLGAAGERQRATSALAAVGVLLPGTTPPVRTAGWGALTPAEQRVATLVAEGLSNPQVADRLFVSPRTVSTHVSRILAKLGARSRTELAVIVYRERSDPGGPELPVESP